MSISLGIYDLFSYMLPGGLYLVFLNEVLRLTTNTLLPIDLGNFAHLVLVAVLSFLLGVVVNPISRSIWSQFSRFRKKSSEEIVLDEIKERHPEINVSMKADEWPLLVAHIRQGNIELANLIDRSQAYSIMLRNFSLGLFLLAATQAIQFFIRGYSVLPGVLAVLLIVFSIAASRESQLFIRIYYSSIFEDAIAGQLPVSNFVKLKSKRTLPKRKSK